MTLITAFVLQVGLFLQFCTKFSALVIEKSKKNLYFRIDFIIIETIFIILIIGKFYLPLCLSVLF